MQNHGLQISFMTMLTSMNVPIEILGLILPFYSIIDMIETVLNVWSDPKNGASIYYLDCFFANSSQ
jgi:L-cystine uptake protein TcyP (sodium:dicarboxylate symporter family)